MQCAECFHMHSGLSYLYVNLDDMKVPLSRKYRIYCFNHLYGKITMENQLLGNELRLLTPDNNKGVHGNRNNNNGNSLTSSRSATHENDDGDKPLARTLTN